MHIRIVRYQNVPCIGQDTNLAIEGYYGFMKLESNHMVGRRVNFYIQALTEDVMEHY